MQYTLHQENEQNRVYIKSQKSNFATYVNVQTPLTFKSDIFTRFCKNWK